MKAKPIFIIGLPNELPEEGYTEFEKHISEKLNDYHVLIFTHSGDEIKFECFYEKDFNKVKYEELKEIIREQIK